MYVHFFIVYSNQYISYLYHVLSFAFNVFMYILYVLVIQQTIIAYACCKYFFHKMKSRLDMFLLHNMMEITKKIMHTISFMFFFVLQQLSLA